ncbi:hypothetical protein CAUPRSCDRAFT_12888 [Caulochytrium protostelioides]|uniref:Cyclin N-terminal domain-containing protein n=1 Tax=Caulochytrium protostelioides TaxID=1555241 RepID=A0A4V1IT09_9FUNG|nr:hypothetical protein CAUPRSCDRAFT_12888 [Caulochytrium protostelioides]
MFLVSVIVATKYLDDRNVSLRSWSRTSGLTPAELRFEEVAFMNTLNHHLWISEMTWSSWQRTLTNDAAPWGAFLPRRDPDTLVPPASTITVAARQDGRCGQDHIHIYDPSPYARADPDLDRDVSILRDHGRDGSDIFTTRHVSNRRCWQASRGHVV